MLSETNITTEFGAGLPKQIGNAHEENPSVDLSKRLFTGADALSKADQTVDLLKNELKRQIGSANPDASLRELDKNSRLFS